MTEQYDVLIVGGGFAGLSAALYTARGMKRGILCGTGPSRNVAAPHTHGFLAQDGADPAQLLQTARDQLAPYDFPVLDVRVERIVGENGDFTAQLANGDTLKARKIILATGVRDILPPIPGFQEEWGRTVHHCPYCYGWEVRGGRIAVYLPGLNNPQSALYYQKITRDVLVCTGGPANLTDEQRALLEACGVALVEEPLSRVDGLGEDGLTLTFGSGLVHVRDVLYVCMYDVISLWIRTLLEKRRARVTLTCVCPGRCGRAEGGKEEHAHTIIRLCSLQLGTDPRSSQIRYLYCIQVAATS